MNETQMLFGEQAQQIDTMVKAELQPNWKCDAFKEELELISNQELKTFAQRMINQLPDYFFHVPASSTGKYHPNYTNGDGGLLRHTKAAVRMAAELLRLEMYKPLFCVKDKILIALILHDGWKHGKPNEDGTYSQYSLCEHAEYCANWIREEGIKLYDAMTVEHIARLVHTHMGEWNINPRTGYAFAPKPATMDECFVHLCDYLASRKCLEMNFNIPFEGWNV